MSVHEYNVARNKALKTMTMGLVFLIFLPIGIPMSLLVVPFLAGRNGARDLPSNWHLTYILTVGGGWSVGLVITLIALLSIALGPALRINIAEIVIFASIILFTWASFTIGVTSSKIKNTNTERPYESEWEKEDSEEQKNQESNSSETKNDSKDGDLRTMALHNEEQKSKTSFQRMKDFLDTEKEEKETTKSKGNKKNKSKKTTKGKESRVSALANRRRK